MAVWPYQNGKAPTGVLVEVEPDNYLRPDAARAWVAFRAACYAATGVWLTITSANRTYARQVELFLERYTTRNTGRKSRTWNGTRYWLRAGAADAATPGGSNHGRAIAVDMGGYLRAWAWIVANCRRFGFSLTEGLNVGEKWHIVYVLAWDGDLSGGAVKPGGSLSNASPIGPSGPSIPEEDDMYSNEDRARDDKVAWNVGQTKGTADAILAEAKKATATLNRIETIVALNKWALTDGTVGLRKLVGALVSSVAALQDGAGSGTLSEEQLDHLAAKFASTSLAGVSAEIAKNLEGQRAEDAKAVADELAKRLAGEGL